MRDASSQHRRVFDDPFFIRRMRLPQSERGGGVRSREWLAPIAYASSFARSVERSAEFFPMLEPIIGARAFGAVVGPGDQGARLGPFLARGSDIAREFAEVWEELQQRAEAPGDGVGPLSASAADAGRGAPEKLQKAITEQIEAVERADFHRDVMELPADDPRRVAWLSCNVISTQWVGSWPTHALELTPSEFREVFATYFAVPSPAVQPHVGQTVPGVGRVRDRPCDAYGMAINLPNLPGGGFTDTHIAIENHIYSMTTEAGFRTQPQPRELFTSTGLPRASLETRRERHARGLTDGGGVPNIVPDAAIDVPMPPAATGRHARRQTRHDRLAMRRLLFDLKIIYGGHESSWYRRARARDERSGAVAERASAVHPEYLRHAERLDAEHSPAGTHPVRDRLLSFTEVRALCFGQYGEASADVLHLLDVCADGFASRRWRSLGARSAREARSLIVSMLRRRLGLVVVQELARFRLRRIPLIGVPRDALTRAARDARAGQWRGTADEPLARAEAFAVEDFWAFQAHSPALADAQ
jgi:hypothetical protein